MMKEYDAVIRRRRPFHDEIKIGTDRTIIARPGREQSFFQDARQTVDLRRRALSWIAIENVEKVAALPDVSRLGLAP